MEEAVQSCYNWGGISRGLFGAVILAEGYYEGWRDLERLIWSSYCWGGISRCLFKAFILAEGYNKGVERSGEACSKLLYRRGDIIRGGEVYLELLYRRRDLEGPVQSNYISGEI